MTSDRPAATMIAADGDDQAPLLRIRFALDRGHGPIVRATMRATSLGIYQPYLNGRPASDHVLSPGWSSYEWRLRYRSYDFTEHLRQDNVLGFALGNGWYRGRLGFLGGRALYGDRLALLAELVIEFTDGHRQHVRSDQTWRSAPSATTANDLYDGQTIDARRDPVGWSEPEFDDSTWAGVEVLPFDPSRLTPALAEPVVRQEALRPRRIWTSPAGKTLVDFGQNMVGWLRFTVQASPGHTITIRHAEVLEHGELGTRPLRTAQATDRFILSGGLDLFEPTLTFHGFRYVEVDGWPGELRPESLEAVVVHSRLQRTGTFECSDDDLNQLHRNVVWSLRGNFVDLPTDCPQRDERLGWTGDIAVFAPTAAYLYDVNTFLQDWLADLSVEQQAAGYVPVVVPDVLKLSAGEPEATGFDLTRATAIWGDAAAWVPWALWEAYGDVSVLARQFDSMTAHVDSAVALLSDNGVWDQGFQFGDWLDPDAPPEEAAASKADPGVVSTAALYRSAVTVSAAARVLGRDAEAQHYAAAAASLREAFSRAYVHPDGIITSDCATVYALAIAFDLLDEPVRSAAGDRLADIVARAGYRVSTGFAGTPYVTAALSQTGHLDSAYRLLLEKSCPSWLYPVSMGATTIWERWDSMLPDGSINPGEMTSFNHYALGAVADWMHHTVAGLSPAAPGYAAVRVAPQPGGGLTWAKTTLLSPHGPMSVGWTIHGSTLEVDIELPDGLPADVVLPGADPLHVFGGTHHLTVELSPAELANAS